VLEAISKLKLKNSKDHFFNLVLYLPAYAHIVKLYRPSREGHEN